jgi:TolB protein
MSGVKPSVVRSLLLCAVLLAAGCTANAAAPSASTAPSTSPSSSPAASGFTADPSALDGHGELAVVSGHELYLLGGPVSGVHHVGFGNQASQPQWSHDGRWLAVLVTPRPPRSNPYADEPSAVWLVSSDGTTVRRLPPYTTKMHDVRIAWSPVADRLAIEYSEIYKSTSKDRDYVEVVDTARNVTAIAHAYLVSGIAWSPDGRRLAVARNRFVRPVTGSSWRSQIDLFPAAGGTPRVVVRDEGGVYDIAGWWPDGGGVLAWIDPMGSASLAADGLGLYDFGLAGHRRHLADMLQYPAWLATSRTRDEVALIAGGDRDLTGDHKHLVICSRITCHSVAQPKGQVSFDPAWSADGRLAVVRDRAVPLTNDNVANYTNQVDASGGIDLVSAGSAHPLPAGATATAPVWGTDGAMMMVRNHALWLRAAGASTSTRVAGPIDETGQYYGFVDWWASFAWSEAVGP